MKAQRSTNRFFDVVLRMIFILVLLPLTALHAQGIDSTYTDTGDGFYEWTYARASVGDSGAVDNYPDEKSRSEGSLNRPTIPDSVISKLGGTPPLCEVLVSGDGAPLRIRLRKKLFDASHEYAFALIGSVGKWKFPRGEFGEEVKTAWIVLPLSFRVN